MLTAEMEDDRDYTTAVLGKYVVVVRATDPSGEPNNENRDDIVVTVTATDVNETPKVTGMAELTVNEADSSKKDLYYGLEYRVNPDGEYLQTDSENYGDARNADGDLTASTTKDNLFKRIENDAVDRAIWPEPIEGDDGEFFEYSIPDDGIGRRLHFINPPSFEDPMDEDGDNVYMVTIRVRDSAGDIGEMPVRITVLNVNEGGKLVLTPKQPDDGMPIYTELTDPDGVVSVTDWMWAATSTSVSAFPMDDVIDSSTIHRYMGSSYTGDAGSFVWAMVDYRDGASVENDPVTALDERNDDPEQPAAAQNDPEVIENKKFASSTTDNLHHNSDEMESAVTDNAVQPDPDPDEDAEGPSTGVESIERMVYENVPSTGYVGDPIEGVMYKYAGTDYERNRINGPDGSSFVFAEANDDNTDLDYYDEDLRDDADAGGMDEEDKLGQFGSNAGDAPGLRDEGHLRHRDLRPGRADQRQHHQGHHHGHGRERGSVTAPSELKGLPPALNTAPILRARPPPRLSVYENTAENTATGTVVGTVTATDADRPATRKR